MRISVLSLFVTLLVSCTAGTQQRLALIGNPLPPIRHITEMKVDGDTLWFVYETEDGFGQRFLRKTIIDSENYTLKVGTDIGRKSDGYFMAYMPYPVYGAGGEMLVVNQEDGEIFSCENDSVLTRTKKYILTGNSILPFPISQYVQDISGLSPDNYVFIGREPNGGGQYGMKVNIAKAEIDTIRRIQLEPELTSWLPDAGELAYTKHHNRLAFAYRLHPIIEIFDTDGKIIKQIRFGKDTFNPATLEEADFEELNSLHFVDISATAECLYALYWNCRYAEVMDSDPIIYKLDWDGNILEKLQNIPAPLYKIAASGDKIIGWNGNEFVVFPMSE